MTLAVAREQSQDSASRAKRASARGVPPNPRRTRGGLPVPVLQRKPVCACGGGCPRCKAEHHHTSANPETAPPIVHEVLRSPGQPLEPATRAEMEPRFGRDFDQVRVHTGPQAEASTRAVGALAYTVGHHIAFGAGRYAPQTAAGKRLLTHELAHVTQQPEATGGRPPLVDSPASRQETEAREAEVAHGGSPERPALTQVGIPVLSRAEDPAAVPEGDKSWWESTKQSLYTDLIDNLRRLQRRSLRALRSLTRQLPPALQVIAEGQISSLEVISDILISLLLAIVGLVVGFVTGIVQTIIGLARLAYGAVEGIVSLLFALFDGGERLGQWWKEVSDTLERIPAGLKTLVTRWWQEIKSASPDRMTLMIGELTGQILSLLVPIPGLSRAVSAATATAGRWARLATLASFLGFREAGFARIGGSTGLLPRGAEIALAPAKTAAGGTLSAATETAVASTRSTTQTLTTAATAAAPAATTTTTTVVGTTATTAAAQTPATLVPQVAAVSATQATAQAPTSVQQAQTRQRSSTRSFLRTTLRAISNPNHPLHFLVEAVQQPGKKTRYDWRKTTRITQSGTVQTGRYEGNEQGVVIQVGHQGAFASGVAEQFTLEDADLNQLTGQTTESRGAYSFKAAVLIGGVPVDLESALLWERLGLLPKGTVANAPRIPPPMPPSIP